MRTGDVRGGLSDALLLALEVRGRAEARGCLWRPELPGNPPLQPPEATLLPENRCVRGLSVTSVGRVARHCAGRRERLACLRGDRPLEDPGPGTFLAGGPTGERAPPIGI